MIRLRDRREISVVVVLILICILLFFTSARGTFYSQANIQNLLLQIALLSTFAIGETIVIITGGIDLSLGSIIAFSGMVLAFSATQINARTSLYPDAAVAIAILATLAAMLAIGSIHASLIHRLRLPPFVVTLAALIIHLVDQD